MYVLLMGVWAFVSVYTCVYTVLGNGFTVNVQLCVCECICVWVWCWLGVLNDVCVLPGVFSRIHPVRTGTSSLLSLYKTKPKPGLFIVFSCLVFSFDCCQSSHCLLLGSSIHSSLLCYYLLPVVFRV